MTSLFRDDCEYETKIAESGALDWLVLNWEYVEDMFEEINTKNISHVVITSRSTLKTHEQHIQKTFNNSNLVFERLNSYTHHSTDYFPDDAKYPFLMLKDPDMTKGAFQESSRLSVLAEETRNTVFYIILQTTTGEGRIEKYENVYWLTLPKILRKNGVVFEANKIGEIAALTLFGETRSRGFLSMLWLDFRYEDISNIDNTHFANIIRESIVSPFYLSREISEYPVFMGYYYSFRDNSPVSGRSRKPTLRNRPRITRPPSPTEENISDNIDDNIEMEFEEIENLEIENLEIENLEIENLEMENKETKTTTLIRPPSPQRAKLPSIESPKRKTAKKKTVKKKTAKKKKPKPGMIINPDTGRNVRIGSKRYHELVLAGTIEPA